MAVSCINQFDFGALLKLLCFSVEFGEFGLEADFWVKSLIDSSLRGKGKLSIH